MIKNKTKKSLASKFDSKEVDTNIYTVKEMRDIFDRLLNHTFGENIYEDISKLVVVESFCMYEILFDLSLDKEKFLLHIGSQHSYVNGEKNNDFIEEFKNDQVIDKKHVISKSFFDIASLGKKISYSDLYREHNNSCFFYLGNQVFRVSFRKDYFKEPNGQVYLLLDIIRRAILSNVMITIFSSQVQISFKKNPEDNSADIKFEDVLDKNVHVLNTYYGFDEIIFENTSSSKILTNNIRGYVFDYQHKKNTTNEKKALKPNAKINKKEFDEVFTLSIYEYEITLYLNSSNYSRAYVHNILKLDRFITNMKVVFQNFFLYNLDRKKFIQREKVLRRTSELDHLTKLLNRVGFYRLVKDKIPRNTNITLIEIDIDDFKKINDTYGHDAGDGILRHISALMSENFTRNTILCRFGGEEFYILIPNRNISEGAFALESFRKAIENSSYTYQSIDKKKGKDTSKPIEIKCTVSSGITTFYSLPEDDKKIDAYLQKQMKYVDKALYKAKKSGKNCIYCYTNGEIFRYLSLNNGRF
ncbi:MAG: GGDEF domain-containing protein [Gammaproteobacteria bacterium]|nr:GGDEF domain-containing protein [Gammaproteobacteria bacterium]